MAAPGKYVPPSRRAGYVPPSTSDSLPPGYQPRQPKPTGTYTRSEIGSHLQGMSGTLSFFVDQPPYARPDKPIHERPGDLETTVGTIPMPSPDTSYHPHRDLLKYIVIFNNAHPTWEDDQEVWVHTAVDKIIADWEGEKKNFARPVPFYIEGRRMRKSAGSGCGSGSQLPKGKGLFTFGGWWTLDKLVFVPARSHELSAMLEDKEQGHSFSRSGRTVSAWAESFNQDWVRIQLSPHIEAGGTNAGSIDGNNEEGLQNPMELPKDQVEGYILRAGGLEGALPTDSGGGDVDVEVK